jgi:ribosome-binding factor A
MANQIKIGRLESAIKQDLNQIIKEYVENKVVKKATIVDVRLTNDLSHAKIYIDTLNRKEVSYICEEMNKMSGFFRNELAKILTIRQCPKLHFHVDETIDNSMKIESIIKEVNK